VSIVTVKGISILLACLGILLFQAALRAYLPSRQALAVTALFAVDYYGVMYNRLGLLENFSCFCFILAFALFVRSRGRRTMAFFLGLTATMAALSKYLFAYFLLAALLAVADQARRRADLKFFLSFLAGGLTLGLPWFFGIYLPFRSTFTKISSGWGMLSLPHSSSQAWTNLVHNPLPRYLALLPVVGFLLVLFIGLALLRLGRGRSDEKNDPALFVLLWLAGAFLAMGLLNYRPLRYYLPLLPALYLAVSLLLLNRDFIARRKGRFLVLVLVPAFLAWPFFRNLVTRPSAFFVLPALWRGLSFLALAAIILSFVTARRKWRAPLEALVFVVTLGSSLLLFYRNFYRNPTYDLETASRYLQTLPAGSVVMGQEAPRLTLETPFRALMAYENWFNDQDPFARYKPTHLLVLNRFGDAELRWIKRKYPVTASGLQEIRKFSVWDTTVTLFTVPETPSPQ
jgi:4-amino-4-deoxy-L-arabinose transferase-like glycosyltransferase